MSTKFIVDELFRHVCISYFEERDDFIRVTEKGLTLDKVDFSKKGYKIDETKYPWNPNKAAASSGKGKKEVHELFYFSDDDEDEIMWWIRKQLD